jgi:hypothetical protein
LFAWSGVFSPRWTEWLRAVPDRRDAELITYSVQTLLWAAILMFVFRLGARRQIPFRLQTPEAVLRLKRLTGEDLDGVPHGDTIEDYLATLNPSELQKIPVAMVRALLEARRLEKFRLLGKYYLLAVDMSGHLYLGDQPSAFTEGCLTQTAGDGRTLYYRPVSEAKLVTRTGLALSVGSEFVQNVPRKGQSQEKYKQDCEQKATRRLLPQVRKHLSGFALCLLLDSLHCNEPTFRWCQQNDCRFIITLKEGSLPSVLQEFEALRRQSPENSSCAETKDARLQFSWVNHIPYLNRTLNVLECVQTHPSGQRTRFVWVTDIEVTRELCQALSQEGGRQRWRIENEGFRTQKHAGFEMEHAYAMHPIPAKNFYLLLQIAHILSQMFECYCQGKRAVKHDFGSLRNLAHAVLESWRRDPIPDAERLRAFLHQAIQIRLDTS